MKNNERRQSEERNKLSQERMQVQLDRNEKINNTLDQADSILNERQQATLAVIEAKRRKDRQFKAKMEEEKK